jgi:hypothetical protein
MKVKKPIVALGFAGGLVLSGVANSAGFDLPVDALSNCFEIKTKSIADLASHAISNGRYVVNVRSDNAHYCSGACPVPKVTFYVTTDNNPKGWFNQVEKGRPVVIDVSGEGTDANIIYAFYTDITCGDNSGGSVLSFRAVTGGVSP